LRLSFLKKLWVKPRNFSLDEADKCTYKIILFKFDILLSGIIKQFLYYMVKRSDQKRALILKSSAEVFAQKGFGESTMSDIGIAASIADSGIYHYFKRKEEILFAIPEYHMKQYFASLEEQLEGIRGIEDKLRKLIWYHSKYFATHRDYAQVLLLECRSNPRFYHKSKAYQMIKQYSNVIVGLAEEGIRQGKISRACAPRLLRDMIMGAIDHATLNWILNDGPNPLEKVETISDLITNSFRPDFDSESSLNPKSDKAKIILNAAIATFTEKGYSDSTVAEIAKRAQVAEGTIYEYYRDKEDLLLKIPEEKLKKLYSYIEEVSPEKMLERMLLFFFRFYNNNPDFTSVLVLTLRPNKNFYKSESHKILGMISTTIANVITQGMQIGVFSKLVHLDSFFDLLFGTIDHIIIPWVMFKRKYDLLRVGEDVSRLFINAIRP